MELREYQERLRELLIDEESFEQLCINMLQPINDPPWYVIAPSCSDPMGPKTCLIEQQLPSNIFPKDLLKGWKDEDIKQIQETSKVPLEASSSKETSTITTPTTPTDEARN